MVGIHWIGPVTQASGYGAVSRGFLKSIEIAGIPLSLQNCGPRDRAVGRDALDWLDKIPAIAGSGDLVVVKHGTAPMFAIVPELGPESRVRKTVGVTIFETDRIPRDWVEMCNLMDEVWLPSEFNKVTFVNSGVDPHRVRVVPYAVDTDAYRPMARAPYPFAERPRDFRFLYASYFDARKGYDLLIGAFAEEFRDEDVTLILKVMAGSTQEVAAARDLIGSLTPPRLVIGASGRGPQVMPIYDSLDGRELMDLFAECTVYVSCDRANGWGMPCMEAMAMGKPAMTIDWSGSTQFMVEGNSFLIKAYGLEPVDRRLQAARPEYLGHRWGAVRVPEVRRQLRSAFRDAGLRAKIAASGLRTIRECFSCDILARRIASLI